MKGILTLLIVGSLTFPTINAKSQVKVDLKKKVTKETNQRANQHTNQLIDNEDTPEGKAQNRRVEFVKF